MFTTFMFTVDGTKLTMDDIPAVDGSPFVYAPEA